MQWRNLFNMKKILVALFIILNIGSIAFAAGSSSSDTKSNYDKAVKLIKAAKKFEKDGKVEKANKRYERALKFLVKSNKEKPLQADTLNYLGFATRKLGDYENGEKYYLLGLEIDPNHKGINEYLGELYVQTDRIEKAKERLSVLKNCNCKEFKELELIIKTRGSKIY